MVDLARAKAQGTLFGFMFRMLGSTLGSIAYFMYSKLAAFWSLRCILPMLPKRLPMLFANLGPELSTVSMPDRTAFARASGANNWANLRSVWGSRRDARPLGVGRKTYCLN